MIRIAKWTAPFLVALVPLGIALPAHARNEGGDDPGRAKKMAALIGQGQLKLVDATNLAERHTKGIALSATCEIRTNKPEPASGEKPPGASGAQPAVGSRLIYSIECFVADKVLVVSVDGLIKTVIGVASSSQP
jgi:hypothetical protein